MATAIKVNAPLDESLYDLLDPDDLHFVKSIAGIESDTELKEHLLGVQRKAYQVHTYPCIRRFGFIKHTIDEQPIYEHVLKLGQEGGLLLDMGCGLGQDLRKLVLDGYPADQLIGTDISPTFWTLGHELFRSTPQSFPVPFIQANIMDLSIPDSQSTTEHTPEATVPRGPNALQSLLGQLSVIHACQFFHFFQEDEQFEVAKKFAALLSHRPGSVIFGQHVGGPEKGFDRGILNTFNKPRFVHSPESWVEMWYRILGGRDRGIVNVKLVKHDRSGGGKSLKGEQTVHALVWSVQRA